MKTIEKAEQQARNGGYDNFVIFSWTSSRGNRLFGHCTLRSPLYAWLTKNEGAEMFSGYVDPKIEKYCEAKNNGLLKALDFAIDKI